MEMVNFLPEEIPRMIKPIISKEADIVNGYRFDDVSEMPKYRKIGNKIIRQSYKFSF